jgi:hypothetical protein
MIDPKDFEGDDAAVLPMADPHGAREQLPYRIELWSLSREAVERVLARAASATLARAIFAAAQSEYLGRHIVLRRSGKVIDASA